MLHIPGLSHRQHRKHTADAQQYAAATATVQRAPLGAHQPIGHHGHDRYESTDSYAGHHVVAETHHLRYLPIKKRHGLFRKPTHHMYEFDTHFHGLHSAIAPHSAVGAHALTPTPFTPAAGTMTSTTATTARVNDERVPSVASPPTARRYGTDISTARRVPPTAAATTAPSPLATATSGTTAMGVERTQVSTITTSNKGDGQDERELLIKTTTRATPAIVDPGVLVTSRAETASMVTAPLGDDEAAVYQEQEEGRAASISTNDMYARAFEDEGAAAGPHPPVMPASEWVETHYRTESGRFEEVVRRE